VFISLDFYCILLYFFTYAVCLSLCVCVPHSNKMMMMKMILAVCKPLPKICAKIQPHFLETLLHTKNYVQMRRNTGFVPYDTHHRFATAWCADRDTLLDFVAFRLLELQFSNSLLLCYYKANVRFVFSILILILSRPRSEGWPHHGTYI